MGQQKQNAEQRQTRSDEMKDRENIQVVCINLALVSGQWK
jgi:hypothetical protein